MGRRVEFDKEKAVELYKSGITPTEIGRLLGVNYNTIILHLKKLGVYKSTGKRSRGTKSTVKKTSKKQLNVASLGSYIANKDAEKKSNEAKKAKSDSKSKASAGKEVTMAEKIAYCDAKYGKGNWYFMTKQEVLDALMFDNGY